MRRILVTAISGDIGNGILRILEGQECHLFGCDVNDIAVGMDKVEYFWKAKYAADEGYIEELLEKCEELQVTHLIPVNEREIEAVSREKARFLEKGIKILILDDKILELCLDKYKTAELLTENGFDVPETFLTEEDIVDKRKRYICKPRKSNGSKNIFTYIPETEQADISDEYVIQEYIDSEEEYTVGVFRAGDITNTISFKRELKNGYSYLVELSNKVQLKEIAERAAGLLDLEGYMNIQLRKSGDKYYIFEINPRISGTVRFRHMLGFSDVLWWLDILDGKKVENYVCSYNKAVGIRELNEKYLLLE